MKNTLHRLVSRTPSERWKLICFRVFCEFRPSASALTSSFAVSDAVDCFYILHISEGSQSLVFCCNPQHSHGQGTFRRSFRMGDSEF